MSALIIKLNATGDVLRTTPLLRHLGHRVTWITARTNLALIEGIRAGLRCIAWEDRQRVSTDAFSLAINLEDELEAAAFLNEVRHDSVFGAVLAENGTMTYTDDSCPWFDLSLISRFGRRQADELKLANRRTYQDLVFSGLGLNFDGSRYLLPLPTSTGLRGDVAIAPAAGPAWPMKNWAYYPQLASALEARGLRVNMLPRRDTLVEHLGDIVNHRVLVSGDSLPMHFALGAGVPCVTLFTCTSPWEIYDYGIQTKIVSPLLSKYFYKRHFDARATQAIAVDEVLEAVLRLIERRA